MDEQGLPLSRRELLVGGIAGAAAALVGALAGPSAAGAAEALHLGLQLVDANVDLVIDPNTTSLVTGTVDGSPVVAQGSLYGGANGTPAKVTGSLAGQHLTAVLSQQDQLPHSNGYLTRTSLTASIGGAAITLSGAFTLDARYSFVAGA